MKKDFKEIVQAMSAKEIIMAMVNGLKEPYTKIKMQTWGYKNKQGVCFGCAATNTICNILGELPALPLWSPELRPGLHGLRRSGISADAEFISSFELAINSLRKGDIADYNDFAEAYGFATIHTQRDMWHTTGCLPELSDDYTEADLLPYIELANSQPSNP